MPKMTVPSFQVWERAFGDIPWEVNDPVTSESAHRLYRDVRKDIKIACRRDEHEDGYTHSRLGQMMQEYTHASQVKRKALAAMGLVMADDAEGNFPKMTINVGEQVAHIFAYSGLVPIDAAQYIERGIDSKYGMLAAAAMSFKKFIAELRDNENQQPISTDTLRAESAYAFLLGKVEKGVPSLFRRRDANKTIAVTVAAGISSGLYLAY